MGVPDNVGGQHIFHKYKQDVDANVFDERNQGIVEPGIYSGLWMTVESDTSARINEGSDAESIIEITDGTVQVKIGFDTDVVQTIAEATPFVILRYLYEESEINVYAQWLTVAYADILDNDLVIGEVIFVGGVVNSFNYTFRSKPAQLFSIEKRDAFKVTPTDPESNVVNVLGGRIQTSKGYYTVVDGTTDPSSTPVTNARYDLVYIGLGGVISIEEGVEGFPPSIPDFKNKAVVAILYRPAGQVEIYSQEITPVSPHLFSMESFESILNLNGASMIGIRDVDNHFDTANLELVLKEIIEDFSSTALNQGASKIGVHDTLGLFDGSTVESVLAEIIQDFASTLVNQGASKIGVYDLLGNFTSSPKNVENVLAELVTIFASQAFGKGASKVGVEDSEDRFYSTTKNVETILNEISDWFVGQVAWFPGSTKTGWLRCNGDLISKIANPEYTLLVNYLRAEVAGDVTHPYYHADADKARLPDTRGRTLRDIDGAGLSRDPDGVRKSGAYQADSYASHTHTNTVGNNSVSHTHIMDHVHTGSAGNQTFNHTHNTVIPPHAHLVPFYMWGLLGGWHDIYGDDTDGSNPRERSTASAGGGTFTSGENSANHSHVITVNAFTGSTPSESVPHNHVVTIDSSGSGDTRGKNIALYCFIKY